MKAKMKLMMVLKIWTVIYPSVTLFLFLLGERISVFPLWLKTLILTVTLVPWMVFIGLPLLDTTLHYFTGNTRR